ncbi:hypothetical protein BJ138DRAFT_988223, partial [Hygrophoropsis aurantiaca]
MPEAPEIQAFLHKIRTWTARITKKQGKHPTARLQLFPRTFAIGTSRRSYTTCSVTKLDGFDSDSMMVNEDQPFEANAHDAARARNQPYEYLVNRSLAAGELHASARGKILAIAAGQHLLELSLGLEAHVLGMTKADFDNIIAGDQPGPNGNRSKAQKLRTFALPARFTEPGSSPNTNRTINIFAAFICDTSDYVWVIVDFARLVRLRVVSRAEPWNGCEMQPSSPTWPKIWLGFGDGPDWFLEKQEAEGNLDKWR